VPNDVSRILILGGTVEARLLAERLEGDKRFSPLTSLAGVTTTPSQIAGEIRTGGFGGAEGISVFLRQERIALIVDATHPFAAQISANAAKASTQTGVPCLRLERPAWQEEPEDRWTHVTDIEGAARAIPEGARVLVTVGRQEVARFFARRDIHVVARMIEPPDTNAPDNAEVLLARPPFSQQQERTLLEDKRITVLVTKNSGGDATYAKILATRETGLPVIMIARPDKPPLPSASTVNEMMTLLDERLA